MTPIPLDKIGLRWRDHKSALWWLALLYRRPQKVDKALKSSTNSKQVLIGSLLILHALPYIALLSLLELIVRIRFVHLIFRDEWNQFPPAVMRLAELLFLRELVIYPWLWRVAFFSSVGIAVIFIFWRSEEKSRWIVIGFVFVCLGLLDPSSGELASGAIFAVVWSFWGINKRTGTTFHVWERSGLWTTFPLYFAILRGIWFWKHLGFTREFIGLTVLSFLFGLVVSAFALRAYYLPVHAFFFLPRLRAKAYPYHPVAWDDLCPIPFPGLDRLLAAYAEQSPSEGQAEIERLITSYRSQSRLALYAQIRLIARNAGRASNLADLGELLHAFPISEPFPLKMHDHLWSETRDVRNWVREISQRQMRLDQNQRSIIREPWATAVYAEVENFQHRIAALHEPLRTEFYHAAERWKEVAKRQLIAVQVVIPKLDVPQVFQAGRPINREAEAFVYRDRIVAQVEQQLMLATGCPGLVLYGRRRTGKSTVLTNLAGLLPPNIITATASMQNPGMFESQQAFILRVAEILRQTGIVASPGDLPALYELLTKSNFRLAKERKRFLVAIDEYEKIDAKIRERVFTEDLLNTIRESIQAHRNITWIFSGSHEISELTAAPWTSYLVSARTIQVPMFQLTETRLLLTEPFQHATLSDRPRFESEFWGQRGIERIHEEAGGWPELVQLIAETIVDMINDEAVHKVTPGLFERALDKCVVLGDVVLRELMHGECTLEGELEYVSAFRRSEEQMPPHDEAIYRSLRRRELVAEGNGYWRLRVPLMARWLRERG